MTFANQRHVNYYCFYDEPWKLERMKGLRREDTLVQDRFLKEYLEGLS